ncbi:MAG: hypothetical protein NTW41_05430 [Verrucomicrobia bacterium]|nr:hypothetical protein [Verrucomicrobiota bacterium]
MAATLYRSSAVSSATYGTPDVSGLIVTSFSVNDTASLSEVKDDQGSVVAVAVSEVIKEISIEGMRTGSFSADVGDTLSVTMPASVTLGSTTIVTGLTTNFAAEQFETVSLTARSYSATMTAS